MSWPPFSEFSSIPGPKTKEVEYPEDSRLKGQPLSLVVRPKQCRSALIGADEISDDERRLAVYHFDRGGRDRGCGFLFVCLAWFAVTFRRSDIAGRHSLFAESE